MQTNYPMRAVSTAVDTEQIAYPVGVNRDSYSIRKFFVLDTNTNKLDVRCTVLKNWLRADTPELFVGTYQQCYSYISDLIKDIA